MAQIHMRRIFSIISCLTLFFLSACSASSQENESIRAENCALIADWNVYINDPSSDYYQGNLNTYDTYTELESRLWGKLKTGDKSYDALVELRKLDYSQNYFKAPQMGEVVTEQNSEDFRVEDDLYNDDASWQIIEKVQASCPAFSREYLAEMFASALNMRD